jgi:phosphatidate cytidylyltransferase
MSPLDDLDPPTFQFGRGRRRRGEEEPAGPQAEEPSSEDELEIPSFDEPVPGVPDQPGEDKKKTGPLWRRLPFTGSETGQRVVIVIPWIIFAITIVALGGTVFMLAMIALSALGLRELFRMTAAYSPIEIPAYLAVAAMIVAAQYGTSFNILLAVAASFPLIFLVAARRQSHENVTVSIAVTLLAITWLGIGFSHATLLRDLPDHGGALLVDVLVATFIGDTAAYGAGRLFGSRKITPRISPNKTLEGLIGGFIGGTMAFWFAGLYQDWLPGTDALIMGMVVAAVAPIGDLFASLVKRDLGVKDTGTLFGPHGGLLDRLDAVLFTVVAGYYLSIAFVY